MGNSVFAVSDMYKFSGCLQIAPCSMLYVVQLLIVLASLQVQLQRLTTCRCMARGFHSPLHVSCNAEQVLDVATSRALRPISLPEVPEGGAQYLLPPGLPVRIGDLEQVAHEGCVALGVGQLVGVDVADGADDGLGEGILVQLQLPQKGGRPIIHINLQKTSSCYTADSVTAPAMVRILALGSLGRIQA